MATQDVATGTPLAPTLSLAEQIAARKRNLKPADTTVRTADGKTSVHKADGTVISDIAISGSFFVVDTKPDYRLSLVFGDWLYLTSQDVPQGFCQAEQGAPSVEVGPCPPHRGGITRILNVACGMPGYPLPSGVEREDVGLLDIPEESILGAVMANDSPPSDAIQGILSRCSPLGRIVSLIYRWHVDGHKVVVHCNAGVSRSATAVIGYLMVYEGFRFAEALALCREKREGVKPNEGFEAQLKELEKRKAHGPDYVPS